MRSLSLLAAALLLIPPGEARTLNPQAPTAAMNAALAIGGAAGPADARSPLRAGAALPAEPQLLARGGGGGRGGGGRGAGGRGGGGLQRGNTGMDRTPRSFDRGNRQPSGGWSRDAANRPDRARPSLDRGTLENKRASRPAGSGDRFNGTDRTAGLNRDAIRDRSGSVDRQALQDRSANLNRDALRERTAPGSRDDWDRAGDRLQNGWNERRNNLDNARDTWANDRSGLNNRLDQAASRYNNYWPGWARPGWNLARPWNWGWYGAWSTPPWGWWGARSVAWGLTSLATAAVINDAVNNAIAASQTVIVVPQSSYQLYYNSIEPSGDQTITFVAVPGQGEAQTWTADCRVGSLNGYQPAGAAEAELLNAACQVAFGS